MNFFGLGIPVGRYFGIQVRLHITFLYVIYRAVATSPDVVFGLLSVGALYLSILLHEFGHALAARWCDGEAHDILLWPLGGLAFVRPAFNPTAHLITTVAGPFVTLVLWLTLQPLGYILYHSGGEWLGMFLITIAGYNKFLFFFNVCIPAFPMDGGRILRDTIWHWMSAETATKIAVNVSRFLALTAVAVVFSPKDFWLRLVQDHNVPVVLVQVPYALAGDFYFLLFPLFILMQSAGEQQIVAMEAGGTYSFSVRERLRRGKRQRQFQQAVNERVAVDSSTAFHRCAVCGLTEVQSPTMDFRICTECSNGQEYCRDHLDSHNHS